MNTSVLRAVFTRNFTSYFSNATGYVFICVFVLLSSFAAFWPNDFFNNNLANLDELNKWFPFIMLIFIPAITMSAWAEERREGTDELLLTMPGNDLDIVLGKYLAAVVIYTVSLLFSMLTNYCVLQYLGNPDVGLFVATYLGYWFVGLAMLAVGMVASFLTSNLTVGYVLGAVLNAPLVFATQAGNVLGSQPAIVLRQWSIGQQMADFGHGVVSLTAVVYFVAIVVITLYLCMVLIGRRHWTSARSGAMTVHYLVRAVALVIAAVGVVVVCGRYEVRGDITEKKLASLAPQTKQLLADLETDRVVKIDAFVSPEVPEDYVQTRLNLLNTLREIQALAGDKIQVRVTETEQFTEEATLAEQRYKITPRQVTTLDQDKVNIDQIFLGVAIRCGLNRVVIPFLDRGIPIEYELIRSIGTVVQQKRKRLGILTTGAPLYGQFNMQTMSAGRNWPIVDELEKQYEVIQIDPAKPIDVKECDVLLAVQPSMLGPQQMDHFVDAVRAGLPTVIFEDPAPVASGGVTATSQQRRPPGGMMMMQQQPPPKGDIQKLWNLLGVEFSGDSVVWQNYNPYPKMADVFWPEFVFVASKNNVDEELGMEGFNEDDPISSGLQELLLLFPGSITELNVSSLKMEPLAETGTQSGSIPYNEIFQMSPFGGPGGLNPRRQHVLMNRSYVMAARIRGEVDAPVEDDAPAENPDAEEKSAKKPAKKSTIDVVLVADVDVISPEIFRLREQPELPGLRIELNFDNVTFVLNALDELAGNTEYIEIRKRRPVHRTLTRIDEETKDARKETAEVSEKANRDFDQAQKDEEKKLRERLMKLEKDYQSKHLDQQEILQKVQIALVEGQKRMNARMEKLEQERDRKIHEINTKLVIKTRQVQERYKLFAVLLPPIPPLLLAGIVFMLRRLREKEGVAQKRLRS